MKIQTYYKKLNSKSQEIFAASLEHPELLSKVHSIATELYKISTCIPNVDDSKMFHLVCGQLESSCLALSFGLYRPALTALRLAFEFGLGGLFFSSNKLAHREWENGIKEADIKWSIINSPDNGVLSRRFANAFFPELANTVEDYQERARVTYRCLSEYVHGNSETWKVSGMNLCKNDKLVALYASQLEEIDEVIKFAFCCRYLREIEKSHLEEIQSIFDGKLTHIEPIRIAFGGPKDIQ